MMYRWKEIDGLEISKRHNINQSDECYYLMNKDNSGFQESEANQYIMNFKILNSELILKPERKYYKDRAINFFIYQVSSLCSSLEVAIIPAVTSKPREDEDFNSGLDLVAEGVCKKALNFRTYEPIFDCKNKIKPSHLGGPRDTNTLSRNIIMRPLSKNHDVAIIIDDVLTSGAHFRVLSDIFKKEYPKIRVIGIFFALHTSSK